MNLPVIRSSAITNHAKGQPCAIKLPGICWGGTETTVFCHFNSFAFGKAMARKATDLAGFFGCYGCHAYVDTGHSTKPLMSDLELERAMTVAMVRTWTVLVNDKVLSLRVDQPKPRRTKARKPKAERAPIHSRNEWPKGRKLQSRPLSKRVGQFGEQQ